MNCLTVESLNAFYGDFQALFDVSLQVEQGEVIALVGANGAGKSTLLRCLTGLLRRGSGSIRFKGEDIGTWSSHRIARAGIALSPEGRRLFPSLTVEENLRLGATSRRSGPWDYASVCRLFPILEEKARQPSFLLSGGQQQMVAIGRALMSNPELLLLDEVSLGLAPVVIRDIYASFPEIRRSGAAVVLVEQDVGRAAESSDRLYCLQEGRINLSGVSAQLSRDAIAAAYFGRKRNAA